MPRIPDLNGGAEATEVNAADLIIIEQGGTTKPAQAGLVTAEMASAMQAALDAYNAIVGG